MYQRAGGNIRGDVNRVSADCVREEKTAPGEIEHYSPLAISPSLPDRGISLRYEDDAGLHNAGRRYRMKVPCSFPIPHLQ